VVGAMGIAAMAARPPVAAAETGALRAVVVGLASGLALYVGTRIFVWLAVRWPPFRADVVEQYGQAGDVSLATSLVLSLVVMVPAEEVFWRGLTQPRLADPVDPWVGALVAWLGYIVANTASRSLPIVAGAIVGGALWSGLAWWSGGVLAGLASHILWTGLMLTLPPRSGREAIEEGAAR
ncbi:MAG TPA: CPBP family intramembrane glutamic endopeptidase, partial [Actinomycetota bacterium]